MDNEHEMYPSGYMEAATDVTLAVGIGFFAIGSEVSTTLMGRGALLVVAGLALKGLHRLFEGPSDHSPTAG